MSSSDLKAYAEGVKHALQALAEVSLVSVEGFSDHQLRAEVSALALAQYGLSMNDVADAIGRQSINLPAGRIETHDRELLLRFDDERATVQELERLVVVGGARGAEIRLAEIAVITDRFELDEHRTVFNGERAAVLRITKTKDQDSLVVVDAVKRFVALEQQRAPPGVRFTLTDDLSSIVADRLQMLVKNGLQGLVLVFLTMWLFFQLRFSFWV